jgi:hypothetical protein
MKATGHDKTYGTGSIVPALAKSARTGHPLFRNGKGKHKGPGHPPSSAIYGPYYKQNSSRREGLAASAKKWHVIFSY